MSERDTTGGAQRELAPRKKTKTKSAADVVAERAKKTREAASAWRPSPQVTEILEKIGELDFLDKKGIATVVKRAIEIRAAAKRYREMLSNGGFGDTDAPARGDQANASEVEA